MARKILIYRLLIRDSDWLNFIHCSGYKYKIRLVSIIWKREDQASISISTILKCSAQLTRAVAKNICFINETVGCKLNFKWTSQQRWKYPIHRNTLKSSVWSCMNEISSIIILKTDFLNRGFSNGFLQKLLCISTAGKLTKLSETFKSRKQQYLPHYYRSEKGFMGTVVNWALLLLKYSVPWPSKETEYLPQTLINYNL